jgi:Na+-transporting NADH:ubiquinone oxidoreductase subunit C
LERSTGYIVGFAAAVCVVCSVFVAGSAVSLKERQERNELIDVREKVLALAGLVDEAESLSGPEVLARFDDRVVPRVVDLQTGNYEDDVDPADFDQRKAAKDPARSRRADANPAKVQRVPNEALVYHVLEGGTVRTLILPIEGYGLWGTLYGFLALGADARTIEGITFYEHKETPGLGGEVDNPRWKALWPGRRAFDENWDVRIRVKKGQAGPPEADPYRVDGLSGATITSRGITNMLAFWLGPDGFASYLEQYRSERGI